MVRSADVADTLRDLFHDTRSAGSILLFSTIGGSLWVPRAARRLLYAWAGADLASAPGAGFRFAGQPRHLSLGRDIAMNQGVFIEATAAVRVGDECMFGMDSMIVTSHHALEDGQIDPWGYGRPVTLGDRVWVGARAVILPGAEIESNVVIAAGAVVAGRCLTGGVYAGVPARRIRDL